MANPQKENGYTAIANEIIEHLVSYNLNGSELAMCLWLIRKTYGFAKKVDKISISQFQRALRLSRWCICKTKKSLVNKRLLVREKNGLKFNKNWEEWVGNKRLLVSERTLGVGNKRLPTKETITKDNTRSPKGSRPKDMKSYNENDFQEEGLDTIDLDTQ